MYYVLGQKDLLLKVFLRAAKTQRCELMTKLALVAKLFVRGPVDDHKP